MDLVARLEKAARGSTGVVFVSGERAERVEWGRLHEEGRAMAAWLQRRGVGPGKQVALLGPTSRALVTAIQAVWLSGAAVVVLPLPFRLLSLEEFVGQTRRRVREAEAAMVLADPAVRSLVEPAPGDPPIAFLDELGRGPGWPSPDAFAPPPPDPERLAVLQFTSGSTTDPRGVMLPVGCVLANLDAMVEAAAYDPALDVVVSWLPLYHDMGLIGLLAAPMTTGGELVLASPQEFVAAPRRWLEWISSHGGTATAGPNFSYALASRAMASLSGLDLSSWRLALSGAEPIDPEVVEAFLSAGQRHGLSARAHVSAYGLAEAALAVTMTVPGEGFREDRVDADALEEGFATPARGSSRRIRRLAILGRPVRGLEVRVVDPASGRTLGEREVGEVQVRGASVTTGYFRRPEATAAAFEGEWFRTGDLGYLVDSELVICGRSKDVIIIGGRNIYPEDVERAASRVEGVRPGNVIAFGVEGPGRREALVVVAEVREGGGPDLRKRVARKVAEAVGLPPKEILLVPAGTIPKTSSGKLQRSLCRRLFLEGRLSGLE